MNGSSGRRLRPIIAPFRATVEVPGSKSITNRALVCAAVATGRTDLTGVLFADDTEAMLDTITRFGCGVDVDRGANRVGVDGFGGRSPRGPLAVDCRQSGTTARFALPLACLVSGQVTVDGHEQLRGRPMAPAIAALRALGVVVDERGSAGHLPVTVHGTAGNIAAKATVSGDVSSQFLSGLLLAAPGYRQGLEIDVTTDLNSEPYVAMTASVMRSFGALIARSGSTWKAEPGGYRSGTYAIEPDASSASYFLAAAAVTASEVTVPGLLSTSIQGDARFAELLAQMGADVRWTAGGVTVTGTGRLAGVDIDMRDFSDTAPTLAVVASFADTPTRVRGIGFVRNKESDRIDAVVTELRRLGINAEAEADGFVIHPGPAHAGTVTCYDDHRIAMSFALLGLVQEGIEIADPGCVGKTFPDFWEQWDAMTGEA